MKTSDSCCGLDCESCDAYMATKKGDNQLKAQVAARWSRIYGRKILPEEVSCQGCRAVSTRGIWCRSMCEVRPCCEAKGFETCAPCEDFPCEKLRQIFAFSREAEERLEAIRGGKKRP